MNGSAEQAASLVRGCWPVRPRLALILGTGLSAVAGEIDAAASLFVGNIPDFPCPTAVGHAGRLVCGTIRGLPVTVMEGRCHVYEGYSFAQVTLPVRTFHALGATSLIAVSAVGGLHPGLEPGGLVAVAGHLDLMGRRTAVRGNSSRLIPGRGSSVEVYDGALLDHAQRVARQRNIALSRGVYVAMTGPSYETRAEYRALRRLGGDVVGMSTVPEVLVASHCGMRVLAISVVTNLALPDAPQPTHAERVVETAGGAAAKIRALLTALIDEDVF